MSLARKLRRLRRWTRYDRRCSAAEVTHGGRIRAADTVDRVIGARYDEHGMNIRMRGKGKR